jgi:hypothetical protein
MGLVKQMMIEEAEREREQECRDWYFAKTGKHIHNGAHLARVWSDFELDEAFEHAMTKDD